MTRLAPALLALIALAAPLAAKDSLGVFASWGAFRDLEAPRCYAIAISEPSRSARDFDPFATVATWPTRNIRGQVHFRLSRSLADQPRVTLQIASRTFALVGGGGDAWAVNRAMDASILAAMRSATAMTVRATDARGRRFSDRYALAGAATAMDAATVACARSR